MLIVMVKEPNSLNLFISLSYILISIFQEWHTFLKSSFTGKVCLFINVLMKSTSFKKHYFYTSISSTTHMIDSSEKSKSFKTSVIGSCKVASTCTEYYSYFCLTLRWNKQANFPVFVSISGCVIYRGK